MSVCMGVYMAPNAQLTCVLTAKDNNEMILSRRSTLVLLDIIFLRFTHTHHYIGVPNVEQEPCDSHTHTHTKCTYSSLSVSSIEPLCGGRQIESRFCWPN